MNSNKLAVAVLLVCVAVVSGQTFKNPVIYQDFADLDIIRVDNTYYLSASTMHYSPGAPILRSTDLVNWEYAGHSVSTLDFGSKFNLVGGHAYVNGIWASFFNYRKSDKTFYWGGCINGDGKTYIYTSTSVESGWKRHSTINTCYYDCGLLIDDDDTMYLAYGQTHINVAQLTQDLTGQVKSQVVYNSSFTLEGSRMYKINKTYYIWTDRPPNGQYILKASNPFGPYSMHEVILNLKAPIAGGSPHQGGLVQTSIGDWYYMSFIDAYPGGRVPALAPVTWNADGWPVVTLVNNAWGDSYPVPKGTTTGKNDLIVKDTFTTLGPRWEWNHNPDTTKFSVNNGLHLQTATVTSDLYEARNTITHRIHGPSSTATVEIDFSGMKDGDRAGLAVLRDGSAYIALKSDSGSVKLVMVNGLTMDASNWNTKSTGTEAANAAISDTKVWLRASADVSPGTGKQAHFSYSTDGSKFTALGSAFVMSNDWHFFMGHRFAIFNYASKALGGTIIVKSFDLTTP